MIGTIILLIGFVILLGSIIVGILNREYEPIIFGAMLFLLFGGVGLILIDGEISPLASEKANTYCQNKGFDTYETYDRKPFGDMAYGIKCKNIMNKKQIITNADTIIATG